MTVVGIAIGLIAIPIRHLTNQAETLRVIGPILRNHSATVAIKHGEVVWLSVNEIDPSTDVGLQKLNEFGYTHFHSHFHGSSLGHKPFGDAELRQAVQRYKNLRVLDLRQSSVTDEGLVHLAELKNLEWLWLDRAQCTDSGLAHLHALTTLLELTIDTNADVPDSRLTALGEALPKCRIHR